MTLFGLSIFVNLFWDSLHWVPESVLFHGLVQLQSRKADFCIQFMQRHLNGPVDSSWRAVAFYRLFFRRA